MPYLRDRTHLENLQGRKLWSLFLPRSQDNGQIVKFGRDPICPTVSAAQPGVAFNRDCLHPGHSMAAAASMHQACDTPFPANASLSMPADVFWGECNELQSDINYPGNWWSRTFSVHLAQHSGFPETHKTPVCMIEQRWRMTGYEAWVFSKRLGAALWWSRVPEVRDWQWPACIAEWTHFL